jgi:ABC-2 type transport system permease protein
MDTTITLTAPVAEKKKMSAFTQELNAILTLFMRGVSLALKSPSMLIISLVMPIMMMGMIGGNLKENMAGGLGFDYGSFMLVGMIVNMLFMQTSMGLTSLVEDRETDFTQEILVSPISRYSIIIGTILGASFAAIVASLGTIVVGLVMGITLNVGQLLAMLALSPLMCLAAGAFAVLLIGSITSPKVANMAVSLITMPQMFLSGAIIPIGHSSGVLWVLSRCMPMTYCLDLVRSVVYAGTPEYGSVVLFNPAVNSIAIVGLTAAFLVIGTMLYARSEKNK